MMVATWNVNSIRARKARLLAWLHNYRPDVLCLQETKVTDAEFPVDDLADLGYRAAYSGQTSYNGVAILARQTLEDVKSSFGDGGDDSQARMIAARVNGCAVLSVYVPNGRAVGTESYVYKLDWLRRLRKFLESSYEPLDRLILCGDFNVAPDARDVHDPLLWAGEILCSDAERSALRHVVEFGLTDAFRLHHEDGGLFSWWDYRMLGFPKNRGLRIDHVYITKPLVSRCTDASIDREERKGKLPSDHAPVIVKFSE